MMLPRKKVYLYLRCIKLKVAPEPWGRLCDRGAVEAMVLLILMNSCRSVRYDLNQERVESVKLIEDSRRERGKV